MPDKFRTRERYGEAFWRKHHEAWQQSALNQREYCEAHGIPLKAFGNWRAKFKAEPQLPVPVVNQIRTYWWCSPPRTGRQRMVPASLTARETGASFSKDKCVLISL